MAYVTSIKLESETIGKKAAQECLQHLPQLVKYSKARVQHIGTVLYLEDKDGNSIGHVLREKGKVVLAAITEHLNK